jgi:membrane-bound lytic murein transglycosylase D
MRASNDTAASKLPLRSPCRARGARARDWRMAALGGSCCSLGIACLLLVACSGTLPRPEIPPDVEPAPLMPVPAPPAAEAPAAGQVASVAPASPWPRLRQRMRMPDCDYNAAVRQAARAFTQSTAQFEASLGEAMPYLLAVLDEIERRDMPGEFALLPYIESTYVPFASSGDRAAGIWQLMPSTAREVGIHIGAEYDGRLDIMASTTAALDLLERYAEVFGDWRLADFAYNAGEYGVRNVAGTDPTQRTAAQVARLRVNPGAHQHLAKLLAVACIVEDPARFRVELPEPTSDDALALVEFPAPVDLALAARITGVDISRMHRFNPGYLRGHMPDGGPYRLLVPAAERQQLEATLATLPRPLWRDWHEVLLRQPESLGVLASANDLDARALAAVNRLHGDPILDAGRHLLLPGSAGPAELLASVVPVTAEPPPLETVHVVHPGDTLWSVAHQQHVRLDDLLRWNRLNSHSTLHVGQRLYLGIPDTGTAGTTTAASAGAR